ncbi:AAA family ATPase [Halobacteria archaeon HArc-gm2]|nr:AAA family ATPase [Halobacteria archaeon HArc-gm2]
MPSLLEIDEFVFDTQALKDAIQLVTETEQSPEGAYSEGALRGALRYFADWGPARTSTQTDPAVTSIDDLSGDEKRDLYNTITRRLAQNHTEQYSHDVGQSDLQVFFAQIGGSSIPKSFATFLVRELWATSERIDSYRDGFDDQLPEGESKGAEAFFEAIRRLPAPYLQSKLTQYDGDDRINGVRYQVLERLTSGEEITHDDLTVLLERENERHDRNITQGYTDFTVLGSLYHDYFKPRLDIYLDDLADFFQIQTGVGDATHHTVNHASPSYMLDDFAWLAIYPESTDSQTDAYQLYLGFHCDHLSYGLHVGNDRRDGDWKEFRDLDEITDRSITADQILAKFQSVRGPYYSLNDLGDGPSPPDKPPRADVVERQLDSAKQVVFYGPPGTGKTFEAKRFAEWWVHERTQGKSTERQVQSVTFHPSFSYEDFVEGLTADATDSGDVAYRIAEGVFKTIAAAATEAQKAADTDDTAPPFILIIDEINRGNLAQIFGEVITLLEADKRGDFETELAHSGETFTLPPNLYVIGTMNTADQSIALVDTALRRRFRFIDFPPDLDVVFSQSESVTNDALTAVSNRSGDISAWERLLGASVLAVEELNGRILQTPDLGKGKQLGHTYLLNHTSTDDVVDAWRYDILPQLEEYYFGQFDRLRDDLLNETDTLLVDWDAERIQSFDAYDLYSALCTLGGIDDPAPLTIAEATPVSDGSGTGVQEHADDAWEAGEKTPQTFRERVERTLEDDTAERIDRFLDVGQEVGRLDTGRGDTATAQIKSDSVDPGVGPIQVDQNGEIDFRWDWLAGTDSNSLTGEFIDDAASVFEPVDGYTHEWDPDAGAEGEFVTPDLNVRDLSDEDITALTEGLRAFVEQADEFQYD